MKVAVATGIFPPDIGGPATFVPMIVEAWARVGHSVAVVTYADPAATEPSNVKSQKSNASIRRVSRASPLPLRYAKYFYELWRAAAGARAVFAQDGVASGFPAWLVSFLRGEKFVIKFVGDFAWEHAGVQEGYARSIEAFQNDASVSWRIKAMRAVQRFVLRRAGTVIVPSRYLGDLVKSWGVPEKRVRVVYNGVDAVNCQLSTVKSRDVHRILTAGRLVPWKRFDVLIEAMPKVIERVPDASLMIVGDGPEEERLKKQVNALGLEKQIRFAGRLKRTEVCERIAESGAFALVSSYEGFSHQLIEAFACGAPVVASRAGGNPEVVRDGENGLLVEVGDIEGTAKALIRLLTDREFAERCTARAKQDVAAFSIDVQIVGTTEAVLGRPGTRAVLISRDGSIVESDSRGAERMKRYGERVESLRVIALARRGAARRKLSERVAAETIDIRNAATAFFAAVRAVLRAARETDANLIITQDPFEAGLVGLFAARRLGVPLIVEEHGGVFLGPHWKSESLKNRLLYPVGLLVMRFSAGLRAVSKKVADDLKKRFPKKPVEEIPVYTEPVNCQLSTVNCTFGYVGRFVPQKNLNGFLAAFHSVRQVMPEATLLMAGAGPLESDLRRAAAEYGVGEAVSWLPFSEDVAAAYARIGTLVLPSFYEGWGRVVVEALQCGIPVVMTDVGCAGEIVRDGVEGKVAPVGDTEALVRAMREAGDPETHRRLSEAAKKRAGELESPDQLTGRLTDFWKKISSP